MPPEKFCGEHSKFVERIGELRGDVRGLGRSLDTLRTQTQSSFREAALKADERHHFRMARYIDGVDLKVAVYMDGVLLDLTGGSGNNPATESTVQGGNYILMGGSAEPARLGPFCHRWGGVF